MIINHSARDRGPVRVALTGANGGYGRTLLAQLALTPEVRAAVLVDPDIAGVRRMLRELGVPEDRTAQSTEPARTREIVADGRLVLTAGAEGIDWSCVEVLVEACGRVDVGHHYATSALANDTHVVMVSKEVDSVAGIDLAARAAACGLSYLPGDGDQPANLLRLVDWVSAVGLDIVAIGKSGEYDVEFDPTTGRVSQAGVVIDAPELTELIELGDDVPETLLRRANAVHALKRAAAADFCEMTVVAMRTGTVADRESMHYPVARIAELADIYAARHDGGILSHDGVVDVFSALRLPGEASFAGGVFAVVRTGDPVTWEVLRGKGHVVSRDGRYACLYWPYHTMGVETPLTIHAAMDRTPSRPPRWSIQLAARATKVLDAGTSFAVSGHHHEIAGVTPVMMDPSEEIAPYYLLDGARLNHAVAPGELIELADLDGVAAAPLAAYRAGIAHTTQSNGDDPMTMAVRPNALAAHTHMGSQA